MLNGDSSSSIISHLKIQEEFEERERRIQKEKEKKEANEALLQELAEWEVKELTPETIKQLHSMWEVSYSTAHILLKTRRSALKSLTVSIVENNKHALCAVDKLVYQLSVDGVIDVVTETIAEVLSFSPSSEQINKIRSDEGLNARNVSYCLLHGVHYPHQHSVATPVCLPPCQHSYRITLCCSLPFSAECLFFHGSKSNAVWGQRGGGVGAIFHECLSRLISLV